MLGSCFIQGQGFPAGGAMDTSPFQNHVLSGTRRDTEWTQSVFFSASAKDEAVGQKKRVYFSHLAHEDRDDIEPNI